LTAARSAVVRPTGQSSVPTIHSYRQHVEESGLMSYVGEAPASSVE
jgi:hypothetical protein